MAQCVCCQSETGLYNSGVPICLKCSGEWETKKKAVDAQYQIRTILMKDIVKATAQVDAANEAFNKITGQVPSGIKDGAHRIHSASRELSSARERMMTAHKRLNDFMEHGIVPEDLQQNG